MKLLNIQTLNGPNYWSNTHKKLIVLKLDLEEYETLPSNLLKNFPTALKTLIPSLWEHRCSKGIEGGFFQRLDEGTWLGHIIEHVALELQWMAGMKCGFGRTFSADKDGVYYVLFAYELEQCGIYAAKAALLLIETLAQNKEYLLLEKDIMTLKTFKEQAKAGPSTQAIIDEALKRAIPVSCLSDSLLVLGHGVNQKKFWAAITSQTHALAADIAADKALTKKLLSSHLIPVPNGVVVESLTQLQDLREQLSFPLVTKPKTGNHGRGITTQILTEEKLMSSFALAKEVSSEVIVEECIEGNDYRILVINYKVAAVAQRIPAHVTGNGYDTLQQLIDEANEDPRRGHCHDNFLSKINLDFITLTLIEEQGYQLNSIIAPQTVVYLKSTANLSAGGTAKDLTAQVHHHNVVLAEKIARLIGLDICGIDVVAKDIGIPLAHSNGAIIEVNAGPGLRMHLSPCEGVPHNVASPIIDMLFPQKDSWKIPIIAVTGTNGKTTVTTLFAQLMKRAGHCVGYTTTHGIYINGKMIQEGDCSGPRSAQVILQSPEVDCAVLECARGGILREGLGFDQSSISIITNITGDHLGLNDIHTLSELARVKSVVARSTHPEGYAILNAGDDLSYAIKDELHCHIALFALNKSARIEAHCKQGGIAIYLDKEFIVLNQGNQCNTIMAVHEAPITFNATATAMILNILPVILAGVLSDVPIEQIKEFFTHLQSLSDILPCRMNLFDLSQCQVMLDYAHNEGAFIELKKYLAAQNHERSIGIIGVAGDRREEDILKLGFLAGEIFDELIIRHDAEFRMLTNEKITELLTRGITAAAPQKKISIISDELTALKTAIAQATEGTFIFCCVEKVFQSIELMQRLQIEDNDPEIEEYVYASSR